MRRAEPGLDLEGIRRLAVRRRALRERVRRAVPGLVVGSATLAGTGALTAWVGHQPGIHTVSTVAPGPSAPPTTADPLSPLSAQLQADEKEVNDLHAALATLAQQRAQAVSAAAGAPAAGAGAALTPAPVVTLPPIPMPKVSSSPAPAVNATTGASHAVP